MIRIILKSKEVLDEAASAETYMRQELRRLFPKIKVGLEDLLVNSKREVVLNDELKFKDAKFAPVALKITIEQTAIVDQPSVGGNFGQDQIKIFMGRALGKMELKITIPKQKSKDPTELFSVLYQKLQNTFLHELIHKGQKDKFDKRLVKDLKSSPDAMLDFSAPPKSRVEPGVLARITDMVRYYEPIHFGRILKTMDGFMANLFSASELEAYARDAYFAAKKQRRSLDSLLSEEYKAIIMSNAKMIGMSNLLAARLHGFWVTLIKSYAKKHLFQKPIPKDTPSNSMQRQQGNYRPPS